MRLLTCNAPDSLRSRVIAVLGHGSTYQKMEMSRIGETDQF